jgi:hypothetical protein
MTWTTMVSAGEGGSEVRCGRGRRSAQPRARTEPLALLLQAESLRSSRRRPEHIALAKAATRGF